MPAGALTVDALSVNAGPDQPPRRARTARAVPADPPSRAHVCNTPLLLRLVHQAGASRVPVRIRATVSFPSTARALTRPERKALHRPDPRRTLKHKRKPL